MAATGLDCGRMRRSTFPLYFGLATLTILCLHCLLLLALVHTRLVLDDSNHKAAHGREVANGMRPPLICSDTTGIPELHETRRVLDDIMVHPPPIKSNERILCFMMTHSGAHRTKVKAVIETWGWQCDGWFIASNATDTELGAIEMKTPALYNRLWIKLNETMRYVSSNYISQYEWFFKVDDDTFVIMENLREFLRIKKQEDQIPQVFGYLLQDESWQDQQRFFDLSNSNQLFADYFLSHVRNASARVEYLAGGSGYIMNRAYLRKFVLAMQSDLTLHGEVPEDMAHGATMLAHNVTSRDSRDLLGREYFIPEEPALWEVRHKAHIRSGQIPPHRKCCAKYTVSFHHISVPQMRDMYDYLYLCRRDFEGG